MERIKRNFDKISLANKNLSSIVCLFKTCIESKYLMKDITDAFNKLVDRKDYRRADYDTLLEQLIEL